MIVVVIIIIAVFSRKSDAKIIKIGIVAPVTGSYAVYGSTLEKGVKMALADITKVNTKYTYQLVVEDDESNPAKSTSAAQKLINIDKVNAIITVTSGSGNAVKPLAAKAGIVHICDCTDVSIANAPYNFTNLVLPKEETKAWLDEAEKKGVKNIAIFSLIHPGAQAIVDSMIPQIEPRGMKVVFNETFPADTRDFKTMIAKAKKTNPDIYYVMSFAPTLDILSKELLEGGVKNFAGSGTITTSPNPSIYNGIWFTDSTLTDLAFKDRFIKENPNMKFNARTVPYGYDIFNMLVQGFEKGGDVYANIKGITEYNGKVGKITKTPEETTFHSQASIWTMKNGEAVMISESK